MFGNEKDTSEEGEKKKQDLNAVTPEDDNRHKHCIAYSLKGKGENLQERVQCYDFEGKKRKKKKENIRGRSKGAQRSSKKP